MVRHPPRGRAALRQPEAFSSRFLIRTPAQAPPEVRAVLDEGWPEEGVLFNQDPPGHTRLRRLVAPAFNPRRMAAQEEPIRRLAEAALDRLEGRESADLVEALAVPLPTTVICNLLGLPAGDAPRIKAWCEDLLLLNSYGSTPEQLMRGARSSVAFQRYLDGEIRDHRARPRDDLLTDLLEAQAEGDAPLTQSELISLLIVLVFAGHETTTNLVGILLRAVLGDGALWERVTAHPESGGAVVEETLRWDSPIQAMFRTTTREVEVAGVEIPGGVPVVLLFGAANRDPAVFADPDRFDPDRPDRGQHLAFGHGIHYCVATVLAQMEARITLEALARRFPGARLDERHPVPYAPNLLHRGPRALHVRLS